jgi:uncharacterized protein GlcG (DUF336 family)/GNAT superfamily N-acetyltransferase
MKFIPLTEELANTIAPWFDDPETVRYLGPREWLYRELQLMKTAAGVEFRGRRVLARHVWVVHDAGGQPFCLVDVEPYEDGTAGIAMLVAPHRRSQGLGRQVLQALPGVEALRDVRTIIGAVEPDNQLARRCFEQAGYVIAGSPNEEGMLRFEKQLRAAGPQTGRTSNDESRNPSRAGRDGHLSQEQERMAMAALKLAQASTILDTALARARALNFAPLAVAVLDAGGHLIVFKREDGAGFARFDIAYGKAWGALGMGFGTRELAERAAKHPTFVTALAAASQGRVIPSPGGVLIAGPEQEIIGAIGISGDTGDHDELCAIAGIQAAGLTAVPGRIEG